MHDAPQTPVAAVNSLVPDRRQHRATKVLALLSAALGLIVLCGWAGNIDLLKRLLPGMVTMKANTAAAFALSGISLYLHTMRQISPAVLSVRRIAAALVLLTGLVTILEYSFGWDAGIDQLLFREHPGAILTSHPGRMSDITAVNFALTGIALLLMDIRFWKMVQATAFVLAASTLFPLLGYLFGNLLLTRIGEATSIAAHTVAGFLMLAAGILAETRNRNFRLLLHKRSFALSLATSLITLVFIFSAVSYNLIQKDKATQWVENTYQVIVSMESFSADLRDFLQHNRGFLITGDSAQLTEMEKSREAALAELARVNRLASADPAQQERLAELGKLVARRMEWSDMAVQVRRDKGAQEAAAIMLGGRADAMTHEIESRLDELQRGEQNLLRRQHEAAGVMSASSLFALGTLLVSSLLLLMWVFSTLRHEIAERQHAEEKIRTINAELEQRVAERTAQLETANHDLESFAYSVSHDLRVPLRAIDGFSRIVLQDYEARLDDEGKRLLNVVRDNTRKMGLLIDDILAFSRTGRLEIRAAEADMETMARDVWQELEPSTAGREVRMKIKPMPNAWGDPAMLRQVWVNLLGNAIKFTSCKKIATIEAGGSVEGDECVFYVKDNGAGFDQQYVHKLFGVFQRLHGVNEFEGTGIGLAIVKRIIIRHGGRAWAEGKIDEGATIHFTLPVKESQHGSKQPD